MFLQEKKYLTDCHPELVSGSILDAPSTRGTTELEFMN